MIAAARNVVQELHDAVMSFEHDPLGFVTRLAFPWGEAGTALANDEGPEPWQRDLLDRIGRGLISADGAVREAVASGHGIGKSALVAWIILWALSTKPDTRGVVTANTEAQLRTKTWPELTKWHGLMINKGWFAVTATSIYSVLQGHDRTWRVDAITWSENNTEAIAGLHNKGKRAFTIFDEASAIPDTIWETIEGALTDPGTELFWCVFGNPTQNTGRFRECFAGGRFAHRWHHNQIDSRTVSFTTNKAQIDEWIADYGEDSDFVRVRVRGVFPRAGDLQFIDSERVEDAIKRELFTDESAPLVMGVDIARSLAGDQSVFRFRKGLDARSIAPVKLRIADLMQVAARVAEAIENHKPDAVFVDATGLGSGVYDRLRQLGYEQVQAVNFGERIEQQQGGGIAYANMRAKMWGHAKDWCKQGCLPADNDLRADLTGVNYGYDVHNAILLEKKDDMKKRGLASPDDGDAFVLTFAYPVARRNVDDNRRIAARLDALRKRVV
jgi:hypothetical protein